MPTPAAGHVGHAGLEPLVLEDLTGRSQQTFAVLQGVAAHRPDRAGGGGATRRVPGLVSGDFAPISLVVETEGPVHFSVGRHGHSGDPRMTDRDAFVRELPKAELHVHIEGTLEPELAFELAARNKVELPYADVDALRRAYRFEDLQSFLDIYYANSAVLRTEQDFYDLAHAYLSKAATQGVRHAEVFFNRRHTPSTASRSRPAAWGSAARSRRRGGAGDLVGADPVLPARPERGGRAADAGGTAALRRAPAGRRPRFRRGGQSSGQVRSRVFPAGPGDGPPGRRARRRGGPAQYIWEALDVLEARRIDHGVRCLEDDRLVARLVAEQVPLTVCPFSNVKLHVFPSLQQHDLPALVQHRPPRDDQLGRPRLFRRVHRRQLRPR